MQTITVKFKLDVDLEDGADVRLHVKKDGEWQYISTGHYSEESEAATFAIDVDSEAGMEALASILSVMRR